MLTMIWLTDLWVRTLWQSYKRKNVLSCVLEWASVMFMNIMDRLSSWRNYPLMWVPFFILHCILYVQFTNKIDFQMQPGAKRGKCLQERGRNPCDTAYVQFTCIIIASYEQPVSLDYANEGFVDYWKKNYETGGPLIESLYTEVALPCFSHCCC